MNQKNDQPSGPGPLPENPPVLYRTSGRVGVITLNRPDNRNAMTPELLRGFLSATQTAKRDPDLRAVVVTSQGSCFSAGADVQSAMMRRDLTELSPAEQSFAMYEAFLSVLDLEVPAIAAMRGHAVGGGFGLALCCDLRFASNQSKLGANFVRLGITPGLGISLLLPRLVGPGRAAELLFTGELIRGAEAEAMGLVNRSLEPAAVDAHALQVAEQIAACGPDAVRATKQLLHGGLARAVRERAQQEASVQARSLDSTEAQEGRRAFLEKRAPEF